MLQEGVGFDSYARFNARDGVLALVVQLPPAIIPAGWFASQPGCLCPLRSPDEPFAQLRSLEDLGLSVDSQSSPMGSPSTDPTNPTSRSDLLSSLREAIVRDLTPRQRAAVLGELAGMPTAVLAEQLDTNANALYKLHHDARLRLRDALEERGFFERDVRSILQGVSNG